LSSGPGVRSPGPPPPGSAESRASVQLGTEPKRGPSEAPRGFPRKRFFRITAYDRLKFYEHFAKTIFRPCEQSYTDADSKSAQIYKYRAFQVPPTQERPIENRPGGGGNIDTEAAVRASPDGYTLLYVTTANAINATLYDKLNFNFIRDIAPVATISRNTYVMVVHPSMPAKTVPEFTSYAKAHPRKVNIASAGTGSPPHVSGELFKMMTGVDMVHVPYRSGGPALIDLLGGQVQVYFASTVSSIGYIRAGRLARSR
jgi:hypothetical protein